MQGANEYQAHNVSVRETPRITNNGVTTDTYVTYYVGSHGPFQLVYQGKDPGAQKIRADIQAKIQDLRQLSEPIV